MILTSLTDDTAAAGVDFFGRPLGDTDNNGPTTGAPGDWRSIRLDRYSNDRNVALVREHGTGGGRKFDDQWDAAGRAVPGQLLLPMKRVATSIADWASRSTARSV